MPKLKKRATQVTFPTASHEKAFWSSVDFFSKKKEVLAITLVGSVLRGQGSYDADVDIDVFVKDQKVGDKLSREFDRVGRKIIRSVRNKHTGKFFDIGLHMRLLEPKPRPRSWTSGPDDFELEIAHSFIYCEPVFVRGAAYDKARKKFTPYYNERLRKKRLVETKKFCLNNIDHIRPYASRKLYFQAHKRFYDATREFLQALFISKKVYPLDYDKWVEYEVKEILQLPKLYKEFVSLYQVKKLESNELVRKGEKLRKLVKKYIDNA